MFAITLTLLLAAQEPAAAKAAESPATAIKDIRILPVSGPEIEKGVIVLRGGKIEAVGADAKIPAGAEIIDGTGLVAMPGLIHPYARIGGTSGSGGGPTQEALEELDPASPVYRGVLRAGFTTIVLHPQGGALSGLAGAFKPRGVTRQEMTLLSPVYLRIDIEAGTGPKDMLRTALDGAKKEAGRKPEKKPAAAPAEADKEKEKEKETKEDRHAPVVEVLKGEMAAVLEIANPAEYLHARQVWKPFDAPEQRIVWHAPLDVYRAAEPLGERKERLLLPPDFAFLPYTRTRVAAAAELHRAGCAVAFTPGPGPDRLEDHLFRVSQLVRAGFPRDEALKAVTLRLAEWFGLEGRVGSIAAGKDADLLLLDGDPFSGSCRVRRVLIDGRTEFEAP